MTILRALSPPLPYLMLLQSQLPQHDRRRHFTSLSFLDKILRPPPTASYCYNHSYPCMTIDDMVPPPTYMPYPAPLPRLLLQQLELPQHDHLRHFTSSAFWTILRAFPTPNPSPPSPPTSCCCNHCLPYMTTARTFLHTREQYQSPQKVLYEGIFEHAWVKETPFYCIVVRYLSNHCTGYNIKAPRMYSTRGSLSMHRLRKLALCN